MEYLSYIHFFCFIANVFLTILILARGGKVRATIFGALLFACLALWSGPLVFVHSIHSSRETATFFLNLGSLGGIPVCPIFVAFSLAFCGMSRVLRSKWFLALCIVPTSVLLFMQWRYQAIQVLAGPPMQPFGWPTELTPHSVWVPVNILYSDISCLFAFALIIRYSFTARDAVKRHQARVISWFGIAAFAAAFFLNLLFAIPGGTFPFVMDAAFLVFAIGIAYAMTRYRLFELTPSSAAHKIIETMSDALLIITNDGIISTANPAALKIFESNETDLVGKSVLNFLADNRLVHGWTGSTESFTDVETFISRPGKKQKPLMFSRSTLFDDAGVKQGMVCIFRDISLRKQAEQEKRELETQLHQAQKMEAVGQLAGGIAHDFNNMLSPIIGYTGMLVEKFGAIDPLIERFGHKILDASKSLADLTAKILAYARKGNYEMAVLDVRDIVGDVVSLVERMFDPTIRISVRHLSGRSTVLGDRTQLQNMLLNLALNARDAMPGGGSLTFETTSFVFSEKETKPHSYFVAPGEYLKISVIDTGTGMDESVRAKLFEPFFTTKAKGKGTGLGLASVYGTVKSHCGHIEVNSTPGMGSVFQIVLPISQAAQPVKNARSTGVCKGYGNILVVDDEDLVREMAAEALSNMGYTVNTCRDGQEAIDYFRTHSDRTDLVLLDLIMPKIGGRECFEGLLKINPRIRVVVVSGYSLDNEAKAILASGALGFLQKPFELAALSQTVSTALGTTLPA